MDTGTIYPDGSVKLDGCTPEKTRIVGISATMIAIHHPGERYWTNGGENYGPANIAIDEFEEITKGKEPGTFKFRLKRASRGMRIHPVMKTACKEAVFNLKRKLEDRDKITNFEYAGVSRNVDGSYS